MSNILEELKKKLEKNVPDGRDLVTIPATMLPLVPGVSAKDVFKGVDTENPDDFSEEKVSCEVLKDD